MIIFESNKGYRVAVRPSGTEPKIKYYFSVNTKLESKNEYESKNIDAEVLEFFNNPEEQIKWSDFVVSRAGALSLSAVSYTHLTLPTNREV